MAPGETGVAELSGEAGIKKEEVTAKTAPGAKVELEADPQTGNVTRIRIDNTKGKDFCEVTVKKEDPLLIQLPRDAHDFTGTFQGPASGLLDIQTGLTRIDILPGKSIAPEPDQQFVLASMPEGVPDGDYTFDFSFDLASSRAIDLKTANLGKLEIYGKTFLFPNGPLFESVAELQPVTLPVSEAMVDLEMPPPGPNGTLEIPCESTPPVCVLTEKVVNSHITVLTQDVYSGLATIEVLKANNAVVSWPPFTPGTTDPVMVTAAKVQPDEGSTVVLQLTDMAGLQTTCDPVFTTLRSEIAERFGLEQNFPNPFFGETTITFSVVEPAPVLLEIYDVQGKRVAVLVDHPMERGTYEARWDGINDGGESVSGGIYLYRIRAGEYEETRAMTLLR